MRIYVMSAGHTPEQEYRWTEDGRHAVSPQLGSFPDLWGAVDHEAASVALARGPGRLALLVTGMPAGQVDFQGREIRNSLLYVCPEGDEARLRCLAALALDGSLGSSLASRIQPLGPLGFTPDMGWLHRYPGAPALDNEIPSEEALASTNSEERQHELAEELRLFRLPPGDRVLVLATRNISPERLAALSVWRGLSNMVRHEAWRPIKKKSATTPARWWAISFLLFVATLLAVAGLFSWSGPPHEVRAFSSLPKTLDGGACGPLPGNLKDVSVKMKSRTSEGFNPNMDVGAKHPHPAARSSAP